MPIHGLYGLAHLGLSHFHQMCEQEKMNYAIIGTHGVERKTLGEDTDPYPVVVLSVPNFLRIHKRLKSKKVCVFIVDNPIQLDSIGAIILGCTKVRTYLYRFFPVKSQDIKLAIESCGKDPIEFELKKTSVIHDLMKAASGESIMSPLQTAFYLVKNLENRTNLQDAVFGWLASKVDDSKVKKVLANIDNRLVTEKVTELMKLDQFIRLRKATSQALVAAKDVKLDKEGEVAKFKMNVQKYANKYKVSTFDLSYVIKRTNLRLNLVVPG